MDIFELIGAQRRALADALDGLSDEDWTSPSLCEGWQVRDVLAHLVFPLEISMPSVMVKMLRARFDFNRMSYEAARGDHRSPAELLAAYRAQADNRFTPPGFGPTAPLTDIVIHGEDMLAPLGRSRTVPPEALTAVLDFVTSKKAARAFVGKGRIDGLRFEAADLDWSFGTGPVVRGNALDLALAICGRAPGLDRLDGDGVGILRSRA